MEKKAMVDQIVAQKAAGFGEPDRAWLDALEDGQVAKFHALCAAPATQPDPVATPAATAPPATASAAPTAAPTPVVAAAAVVEPAKPKSDEEVIAQLSPEAKEMYVEMVAEREAKLQTMRDEVIAQSAGIYSADDLKGKSRAELEKLHALSAVAAKPGPDFGGRGLTGHDATTGKDTTKHAPMVGIKIGA